MKKIFAVLLAVILIMTFSFSAMALVSPQGPAYNTIYINRTSSGESSEIAERVTVVEGESSLIVPTDSTKYEFLGWNIYTPDMKFAKEGVDYEIAAVKKADGTPAVEGTDYTKENGKIVAKDGKLISVDIRPLIDVIYVSENHKGVDIKFNISSSETLSPPTGFDYSVVVILSTVILAVGALTIVSKRAYSK